jgi:hypothetical protein
LEFLDLVKEIGLPLALMVVAIVWLVRLLRDILKGELIVPRYVYDEEVERRKQVERRLERATALAERATYDVAKPAVAKAAHRDG